MCKKNKFPTIEERSNNWISSHKACKGDELDLIVNVQLMPEWEARGFITKDVEAFREKMNEPDLPGESAVLGTRKPADRKSRQRAAGLADTRHKEMMEYAWSYEPIFRGENGKYNHLDPDKWESSIVATKKKSKSVTATYFHRMDRRKLRHDGRAECREIPEMPEEIKEEEREFFPENADGTIDINAWIIAEERNNNAKFDAFLAENKKAREAEILEAGDFLIIDSPEKELIARLQKQNNIYRDFIEEFNLNKLYETWLAQNGKGEGK